MKIPSLTQITLDQIPDASQADQALVAQLNTTQATLYSALQGRLTLTDNITCQQRTIQFTTASNYTTANNFPILTFPRNTAFVGRATNLILTQCINRTNPYGINTGVVTCTNWQDVNGTINIYFITGLLNSTPYQINVLLF